MNDYHDRPTDEPGTEDRPVAGWPGHETDQPSTDQHEHTDEHTDELTGEHTDEAAREDEPLVGEVWNDESAHEHENATGTGWSGEQGHHEDAGQAGESGTGLAEGETSEDTGETGRDHVSEPFGTEEPMVVGEPADADTTHTDTAETTQADTAADTETESLAAAEPVDAAAPVADAESADAVTEPGAEPVVDGARPTAADEFTIDELLESEATERLRDRWREVKGVFVDDPADAVRQASALSGDAVDELTAALGRLRQKLDGHWDEGNETDTERLRVALRGYGSLIDRILTR